MAIIQKIAVVSSKGGHLGQMKILFDQKTIGKNQIILVTEDKKESIKMSSFLKTYPTYFFKKDYLGFNPVKYIELFVKFVKLFKKEKVYILFTNGAQISIPAVLAAKYLGIKSIFLDTVVRVKTPNWSARACYPFADYFWVQHRNMALKYGKRAVYVGEIV